MSLLGVTGNDWSGVYCNDDECFVDLGVLHARFEVSSFADLGVPQGRFEVSSSDSVEEQFVS